MPIISVCMITYNHENYIREAIEGVLMQECNFELELIIANDCSNDSTDAVIKDILQNHPKASRINYINNKVNLGMMLNFIQTLEHCKGKYIALCDGDDYWTHPLKLQQQIEFLENNKHYVLSFHDVKVFNTRKTGNNNHRMVGSFQNNDFETQDLLKPWFIPTTSIVFRKLDEFHFPKWFSHTESGDIALLLLLSLEGKFKYLNKVMGVYRKHETGVSINHTGYSKVFSMIHLYQNFNEYTNKKYENKLHEAMKSEIQGHLPEFHELRRLRRNKKIKIINILQALFSKIVGVL
jgi:glycosyltransferase involved in cell wall biosynthesis